MTVKGEPKITSCKPGENWTCVTFRPDLAKFGMETLEADTVALMRKRVYDLAGILGKACKVRLYLGGSMYMIIMGQCGPEALQAIPSIHNHCVAGLGRAIGHRHLQKDQSPPTSRSAACKRSPLAYADMHDRLSALLPGTNPALA
jgi:hypothetical protein